MPTIRDFKGLSTSTLSDAFDNLHAGGIITGFMPVSKPWLAGRIMTVKEVSGELGAFPLEDFQVGHIIDKARRGQVILIDNGGRDVSTWGFLATSSASLKGIGGVVVNGAVRDTPQIRNSTFPIFAKRVAPTSGKRRIQIESINKPVTVNGVKVNPGDFAVCDADGIAVIHQSEAEGVLKEVDRLEKVERKLIAQIRRGASLTTLARDFKHI